MLSAPDISEPGRERSVSDLLTDLHAWAALASLTALEIVLGVDNVVFISILVGRLDPRRSEIARRIGLGLALIFRIALLFALTSLLRLSVLLARPDPDLRGPLPHRQGDPRDACGDRHPRRGRAGRRKGSVPGNGFDGP